VPFGPETYILGTMVVLPIVGTRQAPFPESGFGSHSRL
jgi:hypothetical protein